MNQLSKRRLNAKGFSAVEVLVVIVIVGLIGAVGWLVYDRQQSKNEDTTQTTVTTPAQSKVEPQTEEVCGDSYEQFENKKMGVAFCYPENWSKTVDDTSDDRALGIVTLVSPDYKEDSQVGFGGSETGSKVTVSVYDIAKLGTAHTPLSKILDGTEQSRSTFSNVKAAKIAGQSGATFKQSYEGPALLMHKFEYKGDVYSIFLEQDMDGPKFNDNQDKYQEIVDSFRLLSAN